MHEPYQAGPDVHVLPSSVMIPGAGVLTVNAYVLHADQPVLIDSCLGFDTDDFVDALASVIDPRTLRWVWLTHDDADHTGSLLRALELAPQAQLVCNAFSALRMSTWCPVPLDRTRAIRAGEELPVGDRTLRAIVPPTFDNPTSTGIVDTSTGTLFSVDSFGAILPESTQNAADVPPEALAGGMLAWSSFDSPWAHIVDRNRWQEIVGSVRTLAPTQILSSHLPAASGTSLETFLDLLQQLPDAEPAVSPDDATFKQMVAEMTAAAPHPPAAAI